jgi:hypothetical protein
VGGNIRGRRPTSLHCLEDDDEPGRESCPLNLTHYQWSQFPISGLVVRRSPAAEKGAIVGKRVKASMAIRIEPSDDQAQSLSEAAAELRVSEAELAAAAVRDLLAHQSAEFDAAAQRVLDKNQELYQRLA